MKYGFYAFLDRMKYIKRWSLMRCVREENIMEHSQQVAMLAHCLALINNKIFGGDVDAEKCVLYAVYHECAEVMTGDLPTPIKYFNHSIHGAYKGLEERACDKLLATLPDELKGELGEFMKPDETTYEYTLMKCADRLSAYIKCLEELRCGNGEFARAKKTIGDELVQKNVPELNYFLEKFIDAFYLSLDELEDDE